ncbi:MAG: hypothetical protein ABSG36_14865 [Acidimicrobiales bacterium]|jgi:HK97 family phage major capsid protein
MPISDSEIKTLRKTTKLQRDSLLTAAASLLKQSRDQEAEFALARADDLNQRLRSLPRITKVKTPPIYGPDSPHSFVLDAVASTGRCAAFGMPSQQEAQARQNLYYEFDANKEVEAFNKRAAKAAKAEGVTHTRDGYPMSLRDLTTVLSSAGSFVPPAILTDEFYTASKAASVAQSVVKTLPLMGGSTELWVPGVASNGSVDPYAGQEDTNRQAGVNATTELKVGVRCFSAITKISVQLNERGQNVDSMLMAQSALDIGEVIDANMATGNGQPEAVSPGVGTVEGQLLGYLAQAGSNETYTATSPTTQGQLETIGACLQDVAGLRNRPAQVLFMTPSRYVSFALQNDADGAPLQRIGVGSGTVQSPSGPLGYVGGVPTYGIPSLANALVDGQDCVIACRPREDDLLFIGRPSFSYFDQTYAHELSVLFVVHLYATFCVRQPAGVAVATGSGFAI